MEKRINKKLDVYITEFKENVKEKATEMGLSNDPNLSALVKYIYDYDRLVLVKEDFLKRKRIKSVVNLSDRCSAKRANGEQCTRRKKDDTSVFCGTHIKGTPHGICDVTEETKPNGYKIQLFTQDIQGITYYLDNNFNVYLAEDVIQNKVNPRIIAKYVVKNDVYSIPNFNF
jgi:hypothetical protein